MKTKLFILIALAMITFTACDEKKDETEKPKEQSINEGKLTVYIDESISSLLDSAIIMYREAYPKIELTVNKVTSRRAVALLFSGEAEAVAIARNYLKDEDSLNKEFNLKRPEMIMAKDGLVFFTNPDFPLDTLNENQIFEIITKGKKFRDYFPNLPAEPELVITNNNHSEYGNLQMIVARNQPVTAGLKFVDSVKQLRDYVYKNKNAIGITYFANVVFNPDFKVLRIGFNNAKGERIPPQVVHQAYILQEKYPYIVDYKVILREERTNRPFWFASFLSKESKVQKYFKNAGIVPAYAKIVLVPQDNIVK